MPPGSTVSADLLVSDQGEDVQDVSLGQAYALFNAVEASRIDHRNQKMKLSAGTYLHSCEAYYVFLNCFYFTSPIQT